MLDTDQTVEAAELPQLLGEPNRLGILAICLDGPLSVGEIIERLTLSQSLVSHHPVCQLASPFRQGPHTPVSSTVR